MKCPKCQSENIKVEDSHRECLDCYHIWEKEDDGTKIQQGRARRVFCPNCNIEMDPTRMTCSECGTYLK